MNFLSANRGRVVFGGKAEATGAPLRNTALSKPVSYLLHHLDIPRQVLDTGRNYTKISISVRVAAG
jgi:hypothetical protein